MIIREIQLFEFGQVFQDGEIENVDVRLAIPTCLWTVTGKVQDHEIGRSLETLEALNQKRGRSLALPGKVTGIEVSQ